MSSTTEEKRIVVFSICIELPFIPTDEANTAHLKMFCRVATEGMKLDVIAATVVTMTEEQARKNFEKAEGDEATEIAQAIEDSKKVLLS